MTEMPNAERYFEIRKHIHPVGSDEPYLGDDIDEINNRQLLCGNCNRKKGGLCRKVAGGRVWPVVWGDG